MSESALRCRPRACPKQQRPRRDCTRCACAPPETPGRNLVAVIGIDGYSAWPRLGNAVADAEGALRLFAKLGFAPAADPLIDAAAPRSERRRAAAATTSAPEPSPARVRAHRRVRRRLSRPSAELRGPARRRRDPTATATALVRRAPRIHRAP